MSAFGLCVNTTVLPFPLNAEDPILTDPELLRINFNGFGPVHSLTSSLGLSVLIVPAPARIACSVALHIWTSIFSGLPVIHVALFYDLQILWYQDIHQYSVPISMLYKVSLFIIRKETSVQTPAFRFHNTGFNITTGINEFFYPFTRNFITCINGTDHYPWNLIRKNKIGARRGLPKWEQGSRLT